MTANMDIALLILRLVIGGLFIGHGTQKLFGWFGGSGLRGESQLTARLGLRPPAAWAVMAALAECGGGLLLLLGFLGSLGPVAIIANMLMATATVHWGKPIWSMQGGAEAPLTNIAVALALLVAGPGAYALDRALGVSLPDWMTPALIVVTAVVLAAGLISRQSMQTEPAAARS